MINLFQGKFRTLQFEKFIKFNSSWEANLS